MELVAPTRSVVLGSFSFVVFWVTATFPKFRGMPVGRTAGAIVGAALMVVFQVVPPHDAYASINLPILGLLFGTMVVSIYLQRADMFTYLASALSYRCRGGKDLLCRLSFLVAATSALFTNDTCCVFFTEFILMYCREKGLAPEPFLLALATSANIGSSATPIGNPQNLVIAIQSRIPFGKFVVGILPAMVVGVTLNLGLLLAMYWNQLSKMTLPSTPDQIQRINLSEVMAAPRQNLQYVTDIVEEGRDVKLMSFDNPDVFPGTVLDGKNPTHGLQHADMNVKSLYPCLEDHTHVSKDVNASMTMDDTTQITQQCAHRGKNAARMDDLTQMHHECAHTRTHQESQEYASSLEAISVSMESKPEKEIRGMGSPRSSPRLSEHSSPLCSGSHNHTFVHWWRERIWKPCVYLVTFGMLAALLAGLDLAWCTITAASVLIVLDFRDAGPSLNKVSYSLLVFFAGMFITVDGFNRTGLPAAFWNAMEPHARINHVSGTAILTAVILVLSNVASNVPTVLLLGPKIAASSAALPRASVTKAWLVLAWTSTVAGNLTLVGSAANLIVCEQARTSPRVPYHFSFWRHLKFGFPSTLLIVAVGLPLIRG